MQRRTPGIKTTEEEIEKRSGSAVTSACDEAKGWKIKVAAMEGEGRKWRRAEKNLEKIVKKQLQQREMRTIEKAENIARGRAKWKAKREKDIIFIYKIWFTMIWEMLPSSSSCDIFLIINNNYEYDKSNEDNANNMTHRIFKEYINLNRKFVVINMPTANMKTL